MGAKEGTKKNVYSRLSEMEWSSRRLVISREVGVYCIQPSNDGGRS